MLPKPSDESLGYYRLFLWDSFAGSQPAVDDLSTTGTPARGRGYSFLIDRRRHRSGAG